MCVMSMITDHYRDKWSPYWDQQNSPKWPDMTPYVNPSKTVTFTPVGRSELDALRKEVEEMKALLKKAKVYDERTGQADCEMADKVAFVKKVAAAVGVSLEDVFDK